MQTKKSNAPRIPPIESAAQARAVDVRCATTGNGRPQVTPSAQAKSAKSVVASTVGV